MQLYDSRAVISDPMTPEIELQLAKIYSPQQSTSSIRVEIVPVQQQEGVHSCGLFSIAYATELCYNSKPESVHFEQHKMSEHLIQCLNDQNFRPFPKSTGIETIPRPTRVFRKIKLYCTCRMPEFLDKRMIACDRCGEWYHCSCVLADGNIPDCWICIVCL